MGAERSGSSRPARKGARRPERSPARDKPVARVLVDVSLPHLDRPFDYLVDETQSDTARPGVRVRVRFSGQLVGGFVLDRVDASEHEGRLAYVERVVSPEPVLAPDIARLARRVADRWAGTAADVVRLAVPPRHAAVEAAPADDRGRTRPAIGADVGLGRYDGGEQLRAELRAGKSPRAVWPVLPGDWPGELAAAVGATVESGRGAVLVAPDHRDVARIGAALAAALGAERFVALTADLGPAERYRRFLAVRRGRVPVVVGTRAAVFAPVDPLGLVVVWDDGDDLHAEPRAPYWHSREVAVLRAHDAGAGLLLAGHAVTAEAAALVSEGWARLLPPATAGRNGLPRVRSLDADGAGDDPLARAARLPTAAWKAARDALSGGAPVLVQVPRRGYQPALACARCRQPARCAACAGPLGRRSPDAAPVCRWCARAATGWSCPECGSTQTRAVVVGARRTAEELGRAFPGVPVRTSGGDTVLAAVDDSPALVVATPGAEPVANGPGYGAVLLLDAWVLLGRADLRAGEEALRRWLNAAALARPGGSVVVTAPPELRPVQALLRWRPDWHAERELADRTEVHLPPAAVVAALTGAAAGLADVLRLVDLPPGTERLGPVPVAGDEPGERLLLRAPRRHGRALAATLKAAAAVRSAAKSEPAVRIEIDPVRFG